MIFFSHQEENLKLASSCVVLEDDDVNKNLASLLGFFGQQPNFAPLLPQIGNTLIGLLKGESIDVTLEALNSIFDVFGEDNTDEVFRKLNMNQILVDLHGKLKNTKIESKPENEEEMDDEEDLQEKLEESLTNLENFIKYKSGKK